MKNYLKFTIIFAIATFLIMSNPTISKSQNQPNKKVLVIGAHPDDPESGCGGTIAILKQKGYEVVCVYLTRGERGIPGKSLEEDGQTEITPKRYDEMLDVITKEKPDIVFTHWPIDGHRDHRICSVLTYDSWRRSGYSFDLYYYEVMSGTQTQMFNPSIYVDISEVRDIKLKSCYAHKSQFIDQGDGVMNGWHIPMEKFRGLESKTQAAEAFVKQIRPAIIPTIE